MNKTELIAAVAEKAELSKTQRRQLRLSQTLYLRSWLKAEKYS